MRLKDRVAIVTGGGTGIGRGISEALAAEGARVIVNYARSKEESDATVAAILAAGGDAVALQTDVTVEAEVKQLFESTLQTHGRLDILVNNAGWSKRTPHDQLDDLTDDIWDRTLNTNLRGAFNCMRQAAPILKQNPGSTIINIASIAPHYGGGSSIVYAASKAGLLSMTKSFARILAPNVRVNSISPGFVKTRFAGWPPETFIEAEKNSILNRLVSPTDIGKAAVFLAADALSMTGENINIDFGQTALRRN
ncbi:3-oxoacyl-ACP reductase [Bryobacterales bacterium F-183]|nr:3-oxoacyl-ACP reductase [Bryobacterales bacterium F-183]